MLLGFSTVILLMLLLIFIKFVLPVIVTKKIFQLKMTQGNFWNYIFFVIFFPLSLLFSKYYYNHLQKNEKIEGVSGFFKIMGTLVLIAFVLSVGTGLIIERTTKLYQSNGQSMYPAIYDKEFIISESVSKDYKRENIIIFNPEIDNEISSVYIKRIIGLPGETIKIEGGKVYILKGNEYIILEESYLDSENKDKTFIGNTNDATVFEIPENSYFVLGDNRNHSTDSRNCFSRCTGESQSAYITSDYILGKVYFDLGYFNTKRLKYIHPELNISTIPKFFNFNK